MSCFQIETVIKYVDHSSDFYIQIPELMYSNPLLLKERPFAEVAESILNDHYPSLFFHLNSMQSCLEYLKQEYNATELYTAVQQIYQSVDQLYRLEKIVIFPLFEKLEREQRVTDKEAPLQMVNHQEQRIERLLEVALQSVNDIFINEDNNTCLHSFNSELHAFKEEFDRIQEVKKSFYEIRFHEA
jgi:hypothetical protein